MVIQQVTGIGRIIRLWDSNLEELDMKGRVLRWCGAWHG
jgi:hypothetical protein